MALKNLLTASACVLVLGAASDAFASGSCETLSDIDSPCVDTASGAVLAPTQVDAQSMVATLNAGEAAFERYFGRPPPRYVVAIGAENRARRDLLRERGFAVFADATAAERRAALETSLRSGMTERLRQAGMSDEQIEQQVQERLARHAQNASVTGQTVAVHEIGHVWFKATFSRDHSVAEERYGSTLPDWLDETAAVLMEDAAVTESRYMTFERAYGADPDQISLADYFTREHPIHRQARALATPSARISNGGPRVLTGEEARAAGIDVNAAANFYALARVFADYLTQRAGNPAVFAEISNALAGGESMEAWLARRGGTWNLPASLDALQADWLGWVRARGVGANASR